MPCVIQSANIPKKRRCSLPALYDKLPGLDESMENQRKKSFITRKLKIKEDVYLSDHTVAEDDPRIMKSLEAMNRIRKRTNFDPRLLKDKCWAAKVCKDLSLGLAKIDEIETERKRMELGCARNLEAEKLNLHRRLEKMVNSSKTNLLKRGRSKSVDYTANKYLELAYKNMSASATKISHYCNQLEAQGGFITQNIKNEAQELFKEDVSAEDFEVKCDFVKEETKLPDINEHHFPDTLCLQRRNEILSVHSRRRAISYSEDDHSSFSIRSSSLPFIGNAKSSKLENKFHRSSLSVPDSLNLMV